MSSARRAVRGTGVLNTRELNRTALERQLLLRRKDLPVVDAVERIVGLNAQEPNLPYLALWSRVRGFSTGELTAALEDRRVVRSTMMRSTQHIVSAPDFQLIRPALAPLLRRVQRNAFGRRTEGIDTEALVAEARELLADGRVVTRPELGRLLAASRPGADATALGWTVQYLVHVVHPPPSGTWNIRGATPFALADTWLADGNENGHRAGDAARSDAPDLPRIVRRYLAAFGPASVADARAWSGLSGLREVFEELRPHLRVYVDEAGRELFDLLDAPIVPEDVPAPVRFLPAFDATLLAYADRTRMMTDEIRRVVCVGAGVAATVLVDGTVAATWTTARADGGQASSGPGDVALLTVQLLRRLTTAERSAVEEEAVRLLGFTEPEGARHDVRVLPPT